MLVLARNSSLVPWCDNHNVSLSSNPVSRKEKDQNLKAGYKLFGWNNEHFFCFAFCFLWIFWCNFLPKVRQKALLVVFFSFLIQMHFQMSKCDQWSMWTRSTSSSFCSLNAESFLTPGFWVSLGVTRGGTLSNFVVLRAVRAWRNPLNPVGRVRR